MIVTWKQSNKHIAGTCCPTLSIVFGIALESRGRLGACGLSGLAATTQIKDSAGARTIWPSCTAYLYEMLFKGQITTLCHGFFIVLVKSTSLGGT